MSATPPISLARSVLMPVMDIGVVWMRMYQTRVLVTMGMRFARRIVGRMRMLMMLVMVMEMFVFQRVVDVLVFVLLGHMQPNAYEHENARGAECPIELALSDCEGEGGTCKRRGREIGSCASCTEVTERANEKSEADSITEKTNNRHA